MKEARLDYIKDGNVQIPIRPTNGCFDQNGRYLGEPEEGKDVLLADEPEVESVALAKNALHPATEK